MKFLGIDTKIIGSKITIYKCLKQLKVLESNFKIYVNPEYLEKFCFVVNVYTQNVYCEVKNMIIKIPNH